jgi:hypothetical protein
MSSLMATSVYLMYKEAGEEKIKSIAKRFKESLAPYYKNILDNGNLTDEERKQSIDAVRGTLSSLDDNELKLFAVGGLLTLGNWVQSQNEARQIAKVLDKVQGAVKEAFLSEGGATLDVEELLTKAAERVQAEEQAAEDKKANAAPPEPANVS